VLPSWLTLYYDAPIELVDGKGCRVVDAVGRDYLDFFGGILTTSIGYNVPEIVEAVQAQAGRMVHTSTLYLIRNQVLLAERIAALSGIPGAKVFFTNSGTEANEAALLFATAARRSNQILALRNSYHGRSFAAVGITGNRGWSPSSLTPVNVSYVMNGYRYRSLLGHLDDAAYVAAAAQDLRDVIEQTTAGDVACLIAEPVQGVGGFIVPPAGYFAALKPVLDEYGILLVSDEVQTAWGRTGGTYFGIQRDGVVADAMTFAKGLGNGLAIGGVVARPELVDGLGANGISTFGGNPLATAAALAVLDYIESHDLQRNAERVGAILIAGLRDLQSRHRAIGEVRGIGLMAGLELVRPGSTTPDAALAARVMEETKRRGLLVGKGGLHGNVVRIAPPLTLSPDEAREGLAVLADALKAATEGEQA
jgi:4-aminobutyrate aminotransferase